jgi:hypothetical protein
VNDCVYCVGIFVSLCRMWHDPGRGQLFVRVLGLMILSISSFCMELHYFLSRSF